MLKTEMEDEGKIEKDASLVKRLERPRGIYVHSLCGGEKSRADFRCAVPIASRPIHG